MTDAGQVAAEIGETNVVVNHSAATYRVVGQTDVSGLPTVGGLTPIADSTEQD